MSPCLQRYAARATTLPVAIAAGIALARLLAAHFSGRG